MTAKRTQAGRELDSVVEAFAEVKALTFVLPLYYFIPPTPFSASETLFLRSLDYSLLPGTNPEITLVGRRAKAWAGSQISRRVSVLPTTPLEMFYSTDILTRRKGGFGVFWLAATLGSKGGTSFKRLTRKEVLGCNLVDACERLAAPEEPLALRLSSNLLCGIVRVYQQQYTIYQADVTQMHQSLKKAFSDVYKNPLAPSNVDLAITPQAGGGAGINLALDPALAIYGWDVDWDVGMDWGNMGLGGGRREGGTPGTPRRKPTGAHQARDSINLQEPHLDDYMLKDEPSFDIGADMGFDAFGGEEGGLLEGHSPELDAAIREASKVESRGGSSARGRGWGGAGASSSAAGGEFRGDQEFGRDDFFAGIDFGGGDEHELVGLDESAEDRAFREHREGVKQHQAELSGLAFDRDDDQVIEGGRSVGGTDLTKSATHKRTAGSDASDTEVAKPAKKAKKDGKKKLATYDDSISLTDEQFTSHRRTYEDRMASERAKAGKAKTDKGECVRALDMIFDVPAMLQAPEMADFWKNSVRMTPFPGGKAVGDKKRKAASPLDYAVQKKRRSVDGSLENGAGGDQVDLGFDYGDFGGGDIEVPLNGLDMGGMDDDAWIWQNDVEQGRIGVGSTGAGSQRNSQHPWNDAAINEAAAADYAHLVAASSQTGDARVSLDTPIRDKRRSRSGSLGSGFSGKLGLDALAAEEGFGGFEDVEDQIVEGDQVEDSQLAIATLEKESFNFLTYTKLQVPNGLNDLLFSDIVPVPTTNEGAAATALYHLLALASKRLLKVEQIEAYGDIRITVV